MNTIYTLCEDELNKLTVCIEEIDVVIGEIINHGIPKEYEEFLMDKLKKIMSMNSTTGKILDVWEDEITNTPASDTCKDIKNTYNIKVDTCSDCPHHYNERIYTPDSFEMAFGCYCTKVEDLNSYNKKHKLVGTDDDVKVWTEIPDWCPMINKSN